jgi:sodium/bile acid cotransporter 7
MQAHSIAHPAGLERRVSGALACSRAPCLRWHRAAPAAPTSSWNAPPQTRRQLLHASGGSGSSAAPSPSPAQPLRQFVADQFLPLALVTSLIMGFVAPDAGVAAASAHLPAYTTTAIFILSGLSLRRGEALTALKAVSSVLFGITSILLLTPLAASLALALPLPRELCLGLAVFCCMPTTLSSGVSLTQAVGGNTALALLLTILTNVLGIFTMPFLLSALLGSGSGAVRLEPLPLLLQLLRTILLPTIAGACARAFVPGVAGFVDANKKRMSYASAMLLATVPWMQVSKAVSQRLPLEPASLLAVAAAGLGIHGLYLLGNSGACQLLQLGGPDGSREALNIRRAVVLVASQKTLPVAVAVLGKLAAVLGDGVGLAVVPCVLSHLAQIIADSVLVAHWLKRDEQQRKAA